MMAMTADTSLIPVGHAILDSGCSISLMGEDNVHFHMQCLETMSLRVFGRILRPTRRDSDLIVCDISGP
eukprot:10847159-Heterocapsa_arctica.AAC.1